MLLGNEWNNFMFILSKSINICIRMYTKKRITKLGQKDNQICTCMYLYVLVCIYP